MTITERLMATGEWSLRFRPDAPREIRDVAEPYALLVIFPNTQTLERTDTDLLALARWAGVITRPGPQLEIGGYGLAHLLGDEDGRCFAWNSSAVLPETLALSTAGSTLNAWLDDIIIPGTLFSRGTTGPAGTMAGSFQWVTPRTVLEAVTAHFGAEWRIRPTLALDVATYNTLYGSVPSVVVSRRGEGRDMPLRAVEGEISTTVDYDGFASKVIVLGSSGRGSSGGASTLAKGRLTVRRVIDAPDVQRGAETATAASFVGLLNSARREVTLSSALYDVSGDIGVGSLVYLHDPDNGILDESVSPIEFRGQWIRPVTVRCYGLQWPVRRGMGVAVRRIIDSSGGIQWVDLTPYIEWEDGDASIEVGAAQQYVQGDQLSMRADLRPALSWGPWQTYAVEWRAQTTNPALGNGTLTGVYRRMGTLLDVRISLTSGTTSTYGAGTMAFTMPPNCVAKTGSIRQQGTALYVLGTAAHPGTVYIAAGDTTMYLAVDTSPLTYCDGNTPSPFNPWAAGAEITVNLTIEIDP